MSLVSLSARFFTRVSPALVIGALLASCGGATRVSTFAPTSLVVFGDENSVITDTATGATAGNGLKYTVNYWDATNSRQDCRLNPVWPQYVANSFGLIFAQCTLANPAATPTAFVQAAAGDRVASVVTKMNAYAASPGFTTKTLVTVMAGQWDILDAYNAVVAGADRATTVARMGPLAGNLATAISNVTNNGNGGRVLVATVPDVGLTPCDPASLGGVITTCLLRQQLLSDLTTEFNKQLDLQLSNNGYYVGLVRAAVIANAVANLRVIPNGYGIINNSVAACVAALPNCTSRVNTAVSPVVPFDLVADSVVINSSNVVSVYTYFWAGPTHFGPTVQAQIGAEADRIARNNPF
ncbi:MAG: hypothetical protein ABI574_12805 [Burkholderiales bacterium]